MRNLITGEKVALKKMGMVFVVFVVVVVVLLFLFFLVWWYFICGYC